MTSCVYYQNESGTSCPLTLIHIVGIIDMACARISFTCTRPAERGLIYWHTVYEDDGFVCAPQSQHRDQLIIHVRHCLWISIFSLGLTGKHGGDVCNSNVCTFVCLFHSGQWHPFQLYISAMRWKVSEGCGIIDIHEALPPDLSIEQRGVVRNEGWREGGTEQRFSCLLCHFLLGEADPRDPPSLQ